MASARQSNSSAVSHQVRHRAHEVVQGFTRSEKSGDGSSGMPNPPARSYKSSNEQLQLSFARYLEGRGRKPLTVRSYSDSVSRLLSTIGTRSVLSIERQDIRGFQYSLLNRGLASTTLNHHIAAIREFFKFLRIVGLNEGRDPMFGVSSRKTAYRAPIVLTVRQVERLIEAAANLTEHAVIEFLYATAVRVSECVAMKLEDVDLEQRVARVQRGKGDKGRIVLFGRPARAAIIAMLATRPSQTPFLFESPGRIGSMRTEGKWWIGYYYSGGVQRRIRIGGIDELTTRHQARYRFDQLLVNCGGFRARFSSPYTPRGIAFIVARSASRAGLGRVHPHAVRRACATHLLEGGADLRYVQEILGHTSLSTTTVYLNVSPARIKDVHARCHPLGDCNAKS